MPGGPDRLILHASCVAVQGRGLLITGPSGSGKSGLALQLMALGAQLVADDRTEISATPAGLVARCAAPAIRGLIEARGLGLLAAETAEAAPLALVVDLSQAEDQRLPPQRKITFLAHDLPLVLKSPYDHFPAAVMQYLKAGRRE